MDNSLKFLRTWLPFGRLESSEQGSQALRDWLEALYQEQAGDDLSSLAELARQMATHLPRLLATSNNAHVRSKILVDIEDEAQRVLPALEESVSAAALPLNNEVHLDALAADNLLKALAAGYLSLAMQISAKRLSDSLRELLNNALTRATSNLFRRQQLAYRAYAQASSSSWLHLHEAYRIARAHDLLGRNKASDSVETNYYAALLLALADPTKFPRSSMPVLQEHALKMARVVMLYPLLGRSLKPSGAMFLVRPVDGRPARAFGREGDAAPSEADFVLDCNPAVGELRREIAEREAGQQSPGEPNTGDDELSLLRTLLAMWRGHPVRRFNRTRFKPRGELVAGIEDLLAALNGVVLMRRQSDAQLAGGSWPLVSEWIITDESPDGFGVRFLKGQVRHIDVGDVVAFRPRERGLLHVCLVRRVSNIGPTRLELGLQELAPSAQLQALPQNGNGDSTGVLLPKMPCYRNAPGLIVRPGSIAIGTQLSIPNDAGRVTRLRASSILQQGDRCQILQLDPVI